MLGKIESRRRSFQTPVNPLTSGSVESFGISEGNITRRKVKQKNPQITCLAMTPSGEVSRTLASASRELGHWTGRHGLHA